MLYLFLLLIFEVNFSLTTPVTSIQNTEFHLSERRVLKAFCGLVGGTSQPKPQVGELRTLDRDVRSGTITSHRIFATTMYTANNEPAWEGGDDEDGPQGDDPHDTQGSNIPVLKLRLWDWSHGQWALIVTITDQYQRIMTHCWEIHYDIFAVFTATDGVEQSQKERRMGLETSHVLSKTHLQVASTWGPETTDQLWARAQELGEQVEGWDQGFNIEVRWREHKLQNEEQWGWENPPRVKKVR